MEILYSIIIACSPVSGYQLAIINTLDDSNCYKSIFFHNDLLNQLTMVKNAYPTATSIHLYGPQTYCRHIKEIIEKDFNYAIEIN